MSKTERTFIAVKPDGVQRGLVGEIIRRFENKGYKLVALKMLKPTVEQAQQHYIDLASKKFYGGLCEYFSSGPIVGMVWEGLGVVKGGRVLLGATNPADSLPGTIRGDLCVDVGRNVCHGSDSVESADKEIAFWFPEGYVTYTCHSEGQVYE
jgi:nucleoside-diphosphate kinase